MIQTETRNGAVVLQSSSQNAESIAESLGDQLAIAHDLTEDIGGGNTDTLDEQAVLLERTLPAIARTLFAVDHGDPLAELPIGQFKMCVTLLREGRRTMSQISETLGISVSAATQMADRLERAGMVERETEPDGDKRTRYLRLTELGNTLLRARVARRTLRARHVLADLTPQTREEILVALQILLGACRETFGAVAPPGE